MLIMPICYANTVHQIEDSMPLDKWAHLGAGYIISDQLHRYTKFTPLERTLAVFCVAYAKERWADSKFDRGDIAATVGGAALYEVNF
ncbi:MAG: hypothetical protein H6Q73_210 [Firmicutes bacterium]|nr:hypothetical protein [Bacillota bacterium]